MRCRRGLRYARDDARIIGVARLNPRGRLDGRAVRDGRERRDGRENRQWIERVHSRQYQSIKGSASPEDLIPSTLMRVTWYVGV